MKKEHGLGPPAAYILAEESYHGSYLKAEKLDFQLTIRVSIPFDGGWNWGILKARAFSIPETKKLVEEFFEKYPSFVRRQYV